MSRISLSLITLCAAAALTACENMSTSGDSDATDTISTADTQPVDTVDLTTPQPYTLDAATSAARVCDGAARCTTGRWCGDAGYCPASECDGFSSPGGCGDGEKCVPAGPGAYACVANGDGAEQSACTAPDDCGAGLLCIAGYACSDLGAGRVCVSTCDEEASVGAPGSRDPGTTWILALGLVRSRRRDRRAMNRER